MLAAGVGLAQKKDPKEHQETIGLMGYLLTVSVFLSIMQNAFIRLAIPTGLLAAQSATQSRTSC